MFVVVMAETVGAGGVSSVSDNVMIGAEGRSDRNCSSGAVGMTVVSSKTGSNIFVGLCPFSFSFQIS